MIMQTVRLLIGSVAVYAVVACATAVTTPSAEGANEASQPADDAGPSLSSVIDALASPVREASAQSLPIPPIVATENCDKEYATSVGGVAETTVYAEHVFPGKTALQLAGVQALGAYAAGSRSPTVPAQYSQQQAAAYVRNGFVGVYCGTKSAQASAMTFASVTFILPP